MNQWLIQTNKKKTSKMAIASENQLGMSYLLAVSFPRGNPRGASAVN